MTSNKLFPMIIVCGLAGCAHRADVVASPREDGGISVLAEIHGKGRVEATRQGDEIRAVVDFQPPTVGERWAEATAPVVGPGLLSLPALRR